MNINMYVIMMTIVGIGLFLASEVMAVEIDKTSCGDQFVRKLNSAIGNIGVAIAATNITLTMCMQPDSKGPDLEIIKWFMAILSLTVCVLSIMMKVKLKGACGDLAQKTLWVLIATSGAGSLFALVYAAYSMKKKYYPGAPPKPKPTKLKLGKSTSEYVAQTLEPTPLLRGSTTDYVPPRSALPPIPAAAKPAAAKPAALSLSRSVSEGSVGS